MVLEYCWICAIIEDGAISSSVDRLGFEPVTMQKISFVATKDTIETTINGYAGLIGDFIIFQQGVLFVILPKDGA